MNAVDPRGLQGIVVPAPGPPLFLPPAFIPGTPENQRFTKDTISAVRQLHDLFFGERTAVQSIPAPFEASGISSKESAWEECHTECEQYLGKDRCSQGMPYTNCMKSCMSRKGFQYP